MGIVCIDHVIHNKWPPLNDRLSLAVKVYSYPHSHSTIVATMQQNKLCQ